MKINILIRVIVIALLNTSCYSTKYTHAEVMNAAITNQTKDGILGKFGIPTEKRVEGSYEEWIYDLGQRTISLGMPSTSNTRITTDPPYNDVNITTNRYGGGGVSRSYNSFIKVTFQNGRTTKWETQGVNYEVTKFNAGNTLLVGLGSAAFLGLVILFGLMGP